MANSSKRDSIAKLDPARFQIAKQMSVVPGGPMNNDPNNVTSVGVMSGSFSGVNQFPYGDSGLVSSTKMGGVYPVPVSGLPQNQVQGLRMNATGYGTQAQPPMQMADQFESARQGVDAQKRGLNPSLMGPLGMPTAVAPGGSVPSPQQTARTLPLENMAPQGQPQRRGKGTNLKTGQRA